jgi:hypothetical protein
MLGDGSEEAAMGQQFVVRVEHRPGALSRLTHDLAVHRVDIHHIAAVAGPAGGHVVLDVDDDAAATTALTEAGYVFEAGHPLMVVIDDRPGGLAEVSSRLAAAGVNILSLMVHDRRDGRGELSLTVDDLEAARRALDL